MPRIESLTIKNYRSVQGPLTIRFPEEGPLVLVGENNAGKSNIIRALNLVLGQGYSGNHDPEDHEFYGRDRSRGIEITANFSEADKFAGAHTEVCWSHGVVDPKGTMHSLHPSRWAGRAYDYMSNAAKDTCVCVVIEADRQLSKHLGYSSRYTFLSRLMHEFHKALTDDKGTVTELEQLFAQVKERFERIQPYAEFTKTLQDQLGDFAGNMTHRLEVDFQAYNPVNFFHALRLHATEDGNIRSLEELGTGEQQILALSFAYAYARTFHHGVVLVIEEPEAHLHPLAQQWLARRINEMCGEGLQIVLTTHSPHFIDIEYVDGLVLVRKEHDGTHITQIAVDELVAHCIHLGAPAARTTVKNILPFYAAMVTPAILEGFFAKAAILVEGATEALALPLYMERSGLLCARDGFAIIPVTGKGSLGKWRRLFDAFGIPTYVVFDNDGKKDDQNCEKRKDALLAVGVPTVEHESIVGSATWIVTPTYTVFGENFERALRSSLPGYEVAEDEARALGVSSKPFVARWVAGHIARDEDHDGWRRFSEMATAIRALLPSPGEVQPVARPRAAEPPVFRRAVRPQQ